MPHVGDFLPGLRKDGLIKKTGTRHQIADHDPDVLRLAERQRPKGPKNTIFVHRFDFHYHDPILWHRWPMRFCPVQRRRGGASCRWVWVGPMVGFDPTLC